MSLKLRSRSPLTSLLQLFLTTACPCCQRPVSGILCASCGEQLQHCALAQPAAAWQGDLPLFAWGQYRGSLRQAIAALKYHNQPQLARDLGHRLAVGWQQHPLSRILKPLSPLVVPIPLHDSRAQARGYNQAALLAQAFCQRLNLPWAAQGLQRNRATAAQFELSAQERQHNVQGAFSLCDHWYRCRPQQPVLLLDDIYTTGATVRAAAQVLRAQHIPVMGVIALARTVQDPAS